ncbi:septum site-determining protein MinC [Salsuginibacillus kocurii]|uniref:septum site-determining protein MinC n=1 Tax=Salsuginibacillus kocurii TaxID=427078 RepID=UPI000370F2FC|nr:septum site-determining protein MinC [Salsuginibacillus kocurii]
MRTDQSKQLVTIKGTKAGLTVHLDDRCSLQELMKELEEKMTEEHMPTGDGPDVHVNVDLGYRYVHREEKESLIELIERHEGIHVANVLSEVTTWQEAKEAQEEAQFTGMARLVRSGQVLQARGDLLVIGDVNPGGTVEATGSIYVLGTLQGNAKAGVNGRRDAVVAAAVMEPAQLMIHDTIYLAPEAGNKIQVESRNDLLYAYISGERNEITFEKIRGMHVHS